MKSELEKLAEEWGQKPSSHHHRLYSSTPEQYTYEKATRELLDRINPCRILYEAGLTLSVWAESAGWVCIDADGDVSFSDKAREPTIDIWTTRWSTFLSNPNYEVMHLITIPLGIDWRTLCVSREQMETYEREREEG
jgi:hypothetical protein